MKKPSTEVHVVINQTPREQAAAFFCLAWRWMQAMPRKGEKKDDYSNSQS